VSIHGAKVNQCSSTAGNLSPIPQFLWIDQFRSFLTIRDSSGTPVGEGSSKTRSTVGLTLVYTISNRNYGQYVHHCFLTFPAAFVAAAAGEMFLLLWGQVMELI